MKKTIIGIVVGVLVGTTANVIASTMLASNIAYTPKDSTWKVNNVEAAIDSLMLSKTETNYSTEEKVVGTWIDGKPIYQRVFTGVVSQASQDIFTVTDEIGALVSVGGYLVTNDNYKFPFNFTQNGSSQVAIFLKPDNKTIAFRGDSGCGNGTYYVTLQYTKTTDSVN